MSMDLSFWKYKKDAVHDDTRVYELACCNGEVVEGLENLPIEEIIKKLLSSFLIGRLWIVIIMKKKEEALFRFLQPHKL